MKLPRRSVRSIQELPSIYTAFPPDYRPVRTHSASTTSDSVRSPDIEDGLEVVPLEHESALSAPIVSAYQDEKEVFIGAQEASEKPLPKIPRSILGRLWGRMSIKYRIFAILGLQAVVLLTVGIALLASKPNQPQDKGSEVQTTGDNGTDAGTILTIDRGTFMVPIQTAQQQSSICLARANESRAWQCAFDTMLQLSILPSQGEEADEPIMLTLGPPSTSNRSIHCGQQAPEIGPTLLTAMKDSNGEPQFRFSTTYNRTVIMRGEQLGQEKISPTPMQGQPKHTNFGPGQSLWRCTFNDTRLEGIIYTGKEGSASNVTDDSHTASLRLPHKVKLMEKGAVSGSVPYCERVVVGDGGALEESGEKVELSLSDTNSEAASSQDGTDRSCQCQWIIG